MRKRTRARESALQVLYQMDITGQDVQEVLENYWTARQDEDKIEEFSRLLTKGTAENMEMIDSLISRYAENWEIKRMAVIDRNVIRLAVYELLYLEDIPPKAT